MPLISVPVSPPSGSRMVTFPLLSAESRRRSYVPSGRVKPIKMLGVVLSSLFIANAAPSVRSLHYQSWVSSEYLPLDL